MINEFISKAYEKLNPVLNRWAVENEKCGKIKHYYNMRDIDDSRDYWCVKCECSNDYHIAVRFYTVDANMYDTVEILTVQVDGPAIITNSYYSVALGYRIPTTVDTYSNRAAISFSEGQFDIDDDSWVNDILKFVNEWVAKDKANVEGVE